MTKPTSQQGNSYKEQQIKQQQEQWKENQSQNV